MSERFDYVGMHSKCRYINTLLFLSFHFLSLAQGCYAAFALIMIRTHDLLIASPTIYPLRQQTTSK